MNKVINCCHKGTDLMEPEQFDVERANMSLVLSLARLVGGHFNNIERVTNPVTFKSYPTEMLKREFARDADSTVRRLFEEHFFGVGEPVRFQPIGKPYDANFTLRKGTLCIRWDHAYKALRWGGWKLRKPFHYTSVNSDKRGKQIADWLAVNPVDAFVILDDDPIELFQDRVVYTDNQLGLTDADVVKIRQLFT